MGTVANITAKPTSTPEGAQALRSISSSAAWGETDAAEARRFLGAAARAHLPAARTEALAALVPATMRDAREYLGPTLSLVAPVGMSKEDQAAWLTAALDTLSGIPADLLDRGCRAARRVADHPSKIVAAIYAEVQTAWDRRRHELSNVSRLMLAVGRHIPQEEKFEPVTQEQMNAIKAEFGLKTNPFPVANRVDRGPAKQPTRDDLAEIAAEIGLSLAPADNDTFVPSVAGLSIAEIFAQRDANRAMTPTTNRSAGRG